MNLAVKCLPIEMKIVARSADSQIRDFLTGDTHGEDLLHALYDHVLDEPVPESMRALLKP
jgi:hypothetical protein